MSKFVGIQFRNSGKVYDFDCGHFVLKKGDKVLVVTEEGPAVGCVCTEPQNGTEDSSDRKLKKVFRVATAEEIERYESDCRLEQDVYDFCYQKVKDRSVPMSIVSVERRFDGSKTIVYFHGNGGHIGYRGGKVRPYLDAGYGMLLVSYRGYGGNPGSPTEDGLYADGHAAMAFLAEQGVAPGQTVVYGESLGTGVAVQIALDQARAGTPVEAVVLEAPFTSTVDAGSNHYPWLPVRWLMKDRFDSLSKIAGIQAPLLIIHGGRDRVVPFRQGKALYAEAVAPKESLWIPDADHNDLEAYCANEKVLEFIERDM